mgnify:CR=1 FL=1
MSLMTPEELARSVANLGQMLQRLVADVEQLKSDRDELRAQYRAHSHTVTTNATAGDGSATSSSGTPK